MLESAATSLASVLVLAIGFASAAYAYHRLYKVLQLQKMANAFEPGDPVLDLAAMGKGIYTNKTSTAHVRGHDEDDEDADHWVQRPEQAKIDDIVQGREKGHYHLLMGEKGTGKSSMLIEAMRKIDGEGVAMFEAHSDLEIFRIRLGKALDYEFHEDYIGGYFSEKGPRDTTALLDIERALNKLEKVALRRRAKVGRPLVMIVNQMHLVRDDEDGRDLIELLQQRAEQWAASNLVTMVFNTDDYWVYERLKLLATRMEVTSVSDLPKSSATAALKRYRARYFNEILSDEMATQVYDRVGGRLSFLNRVAKSTDMLNTCDDIKEVEKTYFLNQCWILGAEMDDDVMDQQKWAVSLEIQVLCADTSNQGCRVSGGIETTQMSREDAPLTFTGRSHGPRARARRPRSSRCLQPRQHIHNLRPFDRTPPALVPHAHCPADPDPRRLCARARPHEPLHHHLQRHDARL